MSDDFDDDVPENVARIRARWFEEHDRTGVVPERLVRGVDDQGVKQWCSVPDAGPDQLLEVMAYQGRQAVTKLNACGRQPGDALAREIAGHLIAVAVASHFRAKFSPDGDSLFPPDNR